jgi:transposase
MMKKSKGQIDMFDYIIFEKLVPKDHLFVKIDKIIDFNFVYNMLEDQYSPIGRGSKDPVMLMKMLLVEYLHQLSDVKIENRTQTDVAYRWFLDLGLDDTVPDASTLSHFRTHRLKEEHYEKFFNEVIMKCIEYDLIKTNRFIVDSTDVEADTNYPSEKKLARSALKKVLEEVSKFNEVLAKKMSIEIELEIDLEYEKNEKVSWRKHFEITQKYLNLLYIKTYDELQYNEKYMEAFGICNDLLFQYTNKTKDKIVSIVDPDARVAHKSLGNIKRGYKDHIIIDEDSEIILASSQTPFNVGDQKKLVELVETVEETFGFVPDELSADKVYGSTDNRAFLKDKEIISNIAFYKERDVKRKYFSINDYEFSKDLESVRCPNNAVTSKYRIRYEKKPKNREVKIFIFDIKDCSECPLKEKCIYKAKKGNLLSKSKRLTVHSRYDAVITDRDRVGTEAFNIAYNKRYKVERRFATLVRNHGLRRCRYRRLLGAKKHITMANIACNIVRLIRLIFEPDVIVPVI